jgi:hypothetical protein
MLFHEQNWPIFHDFLGKSAQFFVELRGDIWGGVMGKPSFTASGSPKRDIAVYRQISSKCWLVGKLVYCRRCCRHNDQNPLAIVILTASSCCCVAHARFPRAERCDDCQLGFDIGIYAANHRSCNVEHNRRMTAIRHHNESWAAVKGVKKRFLVCNSMSIL